MLLFTFTGFWFWVYCIVSFGVLCTSCYRETYAVATFDLLVTLGLLSVTGHIPVVDIWHAMQHRPWEPALWVLGYLALGIAWATIKWKLLLRKLKAKFEQWRAGRTPDDFAMLEMRGERISLPHDLERRGLTLTKGGKARLDVTEFKTRITGWMAYWPVSTMIWIVGDFLADVFDQLYRMVRGFFQSMADSEFDS